MIETYLYDEKVDLSFINEEFFKPHHYVPNGYITFWHGGDMLHKNKELYNLTEFILSKVPGYKVVNCWANRYPKGSYVRPHKHIIHPNTYSAVYYYHCPDGSGDLHIESETVTPKTGQVIIFPSKLEHWTTPNNNEDEKIILGYDLIKIG